MGRLLGALAALALLGACNPLGAAPPVAVTFQNQSTVAVVLRVGHFKPGNAAVADDALVGETPLSPRGSASLELAPGKYTLEATASTPAAETANTTLTITAGTPRTVSLVEVFKLVPRKDDPKQLENQRILGWDD